MSRTNQVDYTRGGRVAPKGLFVRPVLGHMDNDYLRTMEKYSLQNVKTGFMLFLRQFMPLFKGVV